MARGCEICRNSLTGRYFAAPSFCERECPVNEYSVSAGINIYRARQTMAHFVYFFNNSIYCRAKGPGMVLAFVI